MTDDDSADTIDEELIDCPACAGRGELPPSDFLRACACVHCGGVGKVAQQRARYMRDSDPDIGTP